MNRDTKRGETESIFTKRYGLFSYILLRDRLGLVTPLFRSSYQTINKAGMHISLEEYIAAFLMTELIAVPFIATMAFIGFFALIEAGIVPSVVATGVGTGLVAMGIYTFFIAYPAYTVRENKNELDKHIAFAATHMATIAGTGAPPQLMFKVIGDFTEYGPIAKECQNISRNIEVFGYDTISAISESAARTPSHKFRDLLWAIVSVIRTGGEMRKMLIEKSKSLMEEQRRIEESYIETLSMFAKIYSTLFVAGTILIYVMVSIIAILGGLPISSRMLLQVSTYALIPLGSAAFLIVLEWSKPAGI